MNNNTIIPEKLQDILGIDFDELYQLFKEIMNSNFDYIILLSRNSLALYRIFQQLLEQETANKQQKSQRPYVLSIQAIEQLYGLKNKRLRILLMDDIIFSES